jgi:two-component sensor histidine kinase
MLIEFGAPMSRRRGERIDRYETVRQHEDCGLLNISLTVSPIRNAQGKIVGASKIARDITERKRSDEHIAMLAQEAEHRTKNILAIVQAMVNRSQGAAVDDFKRAIEGRIRALANVHSLFVKSRWGGAELSGIVAQELAPYLGRDEARAQIDGPHVFLATNAAQGIAMTLHELATNAAKYGSLSVPEGHLCVKWSRAVPRFRYVCDQANDPRRGRNTSRLALRRSRVRNCPSNVMVMNCAACDQLDSHGPQMTPKPTH